MNPVAPKTKRSVFWPGLILAVVVAIFLRTIVFEPYRVTTSAMRPGLDVGDYVLAVKYAYGFSRYSFPMLNLPFSGRFLAGVPRRGDVVVIRPDDGRGEDLIRRVVGLPGDEILWTKDTLAVNGTILPHDRIADFMEDPPANERRAKMAETNLGGMSYAIFPDASADGSTGAVRVPTDRLFVLCDNRADHTDSRVAGGGGLIALDRVVGRVAIRVFRVPGDHAWWEFWAWPATLHRDHAMTWVR